MLNLRYSGRDCAADLRCAFIQCADYKKIQRITEATMADLGDGHLQAGSIAVDSSFHQRWHFPTIICSSG